MEGKSTPWPSQSQVTHNATQNLSSIFCGCGSMMTAISVDGERDYSVGVFIL
jgi:hypothetical protein